MARMWAKNFAVHLKCFKTESILSALLVRSINFRKMCSNAGPSATLITNEFKLYEITDSGPSKDVEVTKSDALDMYKKMVTIRQLEISAAKLYEKQLVRGFCHLYDGQEAVAVGINKTLGPNDCVITSYRSHGWTYLMLGQVLPVLSELTGKLNGCSRGKGGSMHMYAKNFYGGNGIVGAQVPLGLGVAFALKYRGIPAVCMTLYGDGAANQGQAYEAFNIAKLWNVPCVFVIENNHYGMGTSVERSSAETRYYMRGQYIPGIWVDGMDVVSVMSATRYALDHCVTKDRGPLMLEMSTYRYHGHSMSDPGVSYRSRDEIKKVRQESDPIEGFKKKALAAQLVTEEELDKIAKSVKSDVKKIVEQATKSTEPGPEVLAEDVYVKWEGYKNEIRGVLPWKPHQHKRTGKALNAQ